MGWKEFIRLEKIGAGVDYPTSLFWMDLIRIYPNAKVLFTDRDPVKWYESVKNSILQLCLLNRGFWNLPIRLLLPIGRLLAMPEMLCRHGRQGAFGRKWAGGMFGAVEEGEAAAVQYYKDWK